MGTPYVPGLVSVVIPTYCRVDYLLKTLQSVFAQTRQPLEIIVVDDGSPDETQKRLAPLAREGRIRYVRQENSGQATARNTGAALAVGEYLTFLDHDDLWPADMLAWQVALLESDATTDVVIGDFVPFIDEPPSTPPPPDMFVSTAGIGGPRLVHWLSGFSLCPAISMGAAVMRRNVYESVGGFDSTVWGADDWDFWFRVTKRFRALRVPRLAIYYRKSPGSMSCHVARHTDSMIRVLDRHLLDVPAHERAAVRFYGYSGLEATYGSRLRADIRAFLAIRHWRQAARSLKTFATVVERRVRANAALKPRLLRQWRWRVDQDDPVFHAVHQG